MISCLTNYIGLKGVVDNPASGSFINQLPGITTEQLDAIRAIETYDIQMAWEDVEKNGISRLEEAINKWASRYYKRYSYIDNQVTGQIDSDTSIGNSAFYIGWFFNDTYSYYKNLRVQLHNVELYTDEDKTANIFIFNAATGETLDTISFDFKKGIINRVPINLSYAMWRYPKIFIAYDANQLKTLQAADLESFYGSTVPNNLSKRKSSTGALPQERNLVSTGNEGVGLIVTFSLDCSIDNWVCQRVQRFTTLYRYALGIEFMNERINSNRLSEYTLVDREDAIALRDEWQIYFDDNMDKTLNSLSFKTYDQDAICFECDRTYNTVYQLP